MTKDVMVAEYQETKCGICKENEWNIATRDVHHPSKIQYYCGRCWNMGSLKLELNEKGEWKYQEGHDQPFQNELGKKALAWHQDQQDED